MKRIVILSALFALLMSGPMALMGCNTTEGAGKDIKKTGEKIEDTAANNK